MPIVDAVGRTSGNAQVVAVNQVENQSMLTMEYRRESQGGQNTGVKFLIYRCVCSRPLTESLESAEFLT